MEKEQIKQIGRLILEEYGYDVKRIIVPRIILEAQKKGMTIDDAIEAYDDLFHKSEIFEKIMHKYCGDDFNIVPYFEYKGENILFSYGEYDTGDLYITSYYYDKDTGEFDLYSDISVISFELKKPNENEIYIPMYDVSGIYNDIFKKQFVEKEIEECKIGMGEGIKVKLKDNFVKQMLSSERIESEDLERIFRLEPQNHFWENVKKKGKKNESR